MYTSRVDSVRSVHTVPFSFHFFIFPLTLTVWICLGLFSKHSAYARVCVCERFANRGTTIRELWFSFSLSILDNKRKNGAKHILKRLRMPKGFYCRLLKFGAIKDGVSKRCRQVVTRLPLWILHWLYYPSCAESSHIYILRRLTDFDSQSLSTWSLIISFCERKCTTSPSISLSPFCKASTLFCRTFTLGRGRFAHIWPISLQNKTGPIR